jgi:hypothetical protein
MHVKKWSLHIRSTVPDFSARTEENLDMLSRKLDFRLEFETVITQIRSRRYIFGIAMPEFSAQAEEI